MNYVRLATLGLVLTMLAASGCGSSTKTSGQSTSQTQTQATSTTPAQPAVSTVPEQPTTHTQPLTRAVLIEKADAICRRVNARRASVIIRTRQDFPRLLPALAAYERAAVVQMRELTPPASMRRAWEQIVRGDQLAAEAAGARGKYLTTTKPDGEGALSLTAAHTAEHSLVIAKRAGFKDCSKT